MTTLTGVESMIPATDEEIDKRRAYQAPWVRRLIARIDKEREAADKWFRAALRHSGDLGALKAAVFGGSDWDPMLLIGNFIEMARSTETARQGALARAIAAESEAAALRAEVERLRGVADMIDAIERNCWSLRCVSEPTAGGDDAEVAWVVISYHMAKPTEREEGHGYSPADAIRAALTKEPTPVAPEEAPDDRDRDYLVHGLREEDLP